MATTCEERQRLLSVRRRSSRQNRMRCPCRSMTMMMMTMIMMMTMTTSAFSFRLRSRGSTPASIHDHRRFPALANPRAPSVEGGAGGDHFHAVRSEHPRRTMRMRPAPFSSAAVAAYPRRLWVRLMRGMALATKRFALLLLIASHSLLLGLGNPSPSRAASTAAASVAPAAAAPSASSEYRHSYGATARASYSLRPSSSVPPTARRGEAGIGEKKNKALAISLAAVGVTTALGADRRRGRDSSNVYGGASLSPTSSTSTRRMRNLRTMATPFGTTRIVSPLGYGVSVLRLRIALGFDNNDDADDDNNDGGDDHRSLMRELLRHKKELNSHFVLPTTSTSGDGNDRLRQALLGEFACSVASTLLVRRHAFRSASIDLVRVPSVALALREFDRVGGEEHTLFANRRQKQERSMRVANGDLHQNREETAAAETGGSSSSSSEIAVTLLISIEGDRTARGDGGDGGPFRKCERDAVKALERIVTDARVEGCLVASDVLWASTTATLPAGDEGFSGLVA